jgi:hypothetical protein
MLADMDRRPHRAEPRIAARDAGLERVSVLTRWLGVSAVGLIGLLAGYVWQSKPGGSTGQHANASTAAPAAPIPKLDTGGSEALAPPPQPPVSSVGPTSVGSGGS